MKWFVLFLLSGALINSAVAREPVAIPNLSTVKQQIVTYHDSGAYLADIARVIEEAKKHLEATAPGQPRAAIVLDIDETSLSNWASMKETDFGYIVPMWDGWVNKAIAPAIGPTLELFRLARNKGVACFFVTGRRVDQRVATEQNLASVGYQGYQALYLRPRDDHRPSMAAYKTDCRRDIAAHGWHILENVGDQESDLAGGYADKSYKLPNPMYIVP